MGKLKDKSGIVKKMKRYYASCCDKISLTTKTAFRILGPRKSNFLSINYRRFERGKFIK
jgi:hypothetical protein